MIEVVQRFLGTAGSLSLQGQLRQLEVRVDVGGIGRDGLLKSLARSLFVTGEQPVVTVIAKCTGRGGIGRDGAAVDGIGFGEFLLVVQRDAKVGSEYRYQLTAVHSLGDVRTRVVGGKEAMSYWDLEVPHFVLEQGPPWLKIDGNTGLLSGVPDRPGKVGVVVTATIDRAVRKLDHRSLSWGLEKVVSTGTQGVGAATQKFTIDVAPDSE